MPRYAMPRRCTLSRDAMSMLDAAAPRLIAAMLDAIRDADMLLPAMMLILPLLRVTRDVIDAMRDMMLRYAQICYGAARERCRKSARY